MTNAEALDLNKSLSINPDLNPERPLQYHQRTGHVLPNMRDYTKVQEMKLNSEVRSSFLINLKYMTFYLSVILRKEKS